MKSGIYEMGSIAYSIFRTLIVLNLAAGCAAPAPVVIGAVETLRVVEADLAFRARIDTGAEASSIHATGIRVEGTEVRFTLDDGEGSSRSLSAPIVDVAHVRTAQSVDLRYRVALHLSLRGVEKRVVVSLRDRSSMDYRLLVGRDFLAGDFLVDVGRSQRSIGPGAAP